RREDFAEESTEIDRVQRLVRTRRSGQPMGGLELGRARAPRGAWLRRQALQQTGEDVGGVADQRVEGGLDLPDLRRVDVDVGDRGVRAELGYLAGGAIVEARSDREQQIGLLEQEICALGGVHA